MRSSGLVRLPFPIFLLAGLLTILSFTGIELADGPVTDDPSSDLVVLPVKPVPLVIATGKSEVTKRVRVRVANAEAAARTARLIATDGDCPSGTVVRAPDFDTRAVGAQDAVLLGGGKVRSATIELRATSDGVLSLGRKAPHRCRLRLRVEPSPVATDVSPTNDVTDIELDVVDRNDPQQPTAHEALVRSAKPVTIDIAKSKAMATKPIRVVVGNADHTGADPITLAASDGDCPTGTVGRADFEARTPGTQDGALVAGGKTAAAKLVVSVDAARFATFRAGSPARCVALLTATGPAGMADPDPSNDVTRLVIDVVDKNDVGLPTPTPTTVATPTPTPVVTPTPSPTPTATATPVPTGGLPPEPATVAPALDPTIASNIFRATEFLYTGANPIQTGVSAGAIDPVRAAVVRGRVLDSSGAALPGATVALLGQPDLGQTLSRASGGFDLVVNGGGPLTVTIEKAGFLPVQRTLDVPWQEYALVPDVVLVPTDAQASAIDLLSTEPFQVAHGSVQSDTRGTRRATLLFAQGTQGDLVLPDGTTQPVTELHVRLTEYTVGDDGPAAMPAELPPTSGYTYAVELGADEITAAGATTAQFSQPVLFYLENFIGMPAGVQVPMAFYDRTRAAWVPTLDGKVVAILAVAPGGDAELDTDGDGLADDGSALSPPVTAAERAQLGSLYAAGQSLWRVPVSHFTSYDPNYGVVPGAGAQDPSQPMPVQASYPKLDQSSQQDGYGVIDIQNQSFRETLPVVGTPYLLAYASDRMSGYTAANTVRIAVSGATLPSGIKRIDLTIEVAGRRIVQSYSPATGLTYDFVWDGTDAYGRAVRGEQTAQIRIDYVYDGFYALPPALAETFGFPSGVKVPGDVPSRTDAARSQRFRVKLGRSPARDFGGWSLSPQHVYDPIGETIYLGDGRRRSARDLNASVLSRVAGTGDAGDAGDGGAARSAQLNGPRDVAVSPDGALYVADTDNHRIRRVARDGTITTVAGTGSPGSAGDGGPAVSAQLAYPSSVAIGPDGSVYVAVLDGARIRRVARDGVITTAVGTGTPGFSGDGGPATQANIGESVLGLAVAPDDTLFLTDGNRVRRVSPSGTIATVAGTGVAGFSGDGGPATSAKLSSPTDIALGRDGSLYVVDRDNLVVRRVGPDGVITTVAGVAPPVTVSSGGLDWLAQAPRAAELVARIARGARDLAAEGVALASGVVGGDGDGGPATDAHLNVPSGIAVAPDGTIFISEDDRVRAVAADGVIRTIAGSGSTLSDDMPAAQAYLDSPGGLAVAPDGSLYLADPYRDFYVAPPGSANVVRRVAGVLPGFTAGQIAIAAESGSELYQFDANGRHLRTVHALTGATQQEFGYDAAGRLTSVRDANDNLTTIERDGDGRPLSIVGPYGQRTTLSLDANDHLAALTTPGLLTTQLVHDAGGLLTAITSARGNTYTVAYDAQGRVAQVVDPAGGSSTLASMATAAGRSVVQTTALGRMASFLVEDLSTGVLHQSSSAWDGTITETATGRDGRTTRAAADGSTASRLAGTDPQYGLQPSLAAATQIKTPGGATLSAAAEHTAIFTVPGDPSSLGSLTDTIRLNDRTFVRNVDAATRTITLTSPTGRQTITTIDSQGRPVVLARSGLATTTVAYDAMGRIGSVTQGGGAGARTQTFGYGTDGLLASFVDPIGRTFLFDRDADGRLTSLTRPDTTTVGFGFDHEGNTSAIYAPGGAVHGFEHSQVNLPTSYVPPIVGGVPQPMLLAYDLDRQLATISRADGGVLEQEYEPLTGRLHTSTSPDRQVTYSYDGATGKPTRIAASDGPVLDYLHDGFLPTSEAWSGPVVGEVQRTHDDDLRRSAITVAGTAPVAFGYDEDGLVIAAGPLTLDRDPRSGLVTDTTVGGATTTLTHDAFGAVVGATAEFAGSPLYAAVLTRDQLGRVTDVTETISGVTHVSHYAYDPVGRLIDAQRDAATTTYGYDANGNRVSASDTGATGVYDAQDRVLSYGPTTYVHSAAGDRSSKTSAMQTTTYTYDVRGNLRTVSLPDGRQIDYVVDGRNRRIGRTVDGALVEGLLYLDALRPIATLDATNSVVSVFVYAGAESVPAVILRGGSTYRIVTDHTGSPRLVVDVATGAVVQRLDYDAFGRVTLDTNPGFQPFGFAGGLYDPDTGLVRFGQRDYDADVGRWTTKDPAGFAGGDTNLYAYVGNDPINGSDPTGTGPTWQQKSYKVLKDLYGSFSKANREMNAQLHTLTFTTVVIGSMLLPPSRSNLKSLYLAKNSVVVGETVAEEAAIGGLQPYAKSGYDVINFSIETAEELGVQQEILQATGSSAEGIVPAAVEDIGTLLRGLYK